MESEKPTSIFKKLFRPQKSSCCNVKIEEITDEDDENKTRVQDKNVQTPCCGNGKTDEN